MICTLIQTYTSVIQYNMYNDSNMTASVATDSEMNVSHCLPVWLIDMLSLQCSDD